MRVRPQNQEVPISKLVLLTLEVPNAAVFPYSTVLYCSLFSIDLRLTISNLINANRMRPGLSGSGLGTNRGRPDWAYSIPVGCCGRARHAEICSAGRAGAAGAVVVALTGLFREQHAVCHAPHQRGAT
eukprot:COSAG02_NODE_3815_length_6192_cov_2.112260_5_plen_128_part_00